MSRGGGRGMICLGALRGSDNPFADAGLPDADTELMKADLATAYITIPQH